MRHCLSALASPCVLSLLAACLIASSAQATGPLPPAGAGQAILSFEPSISTAQFDARGALKPASSWSQTTLTTYLEWGLDDKDAAIVSLPAERVRSAQDAPHLGLAPSEIGLRRALWTRGALTFAVESSALAPAGGAGFVEATGAGRHLGYGAATLAFAQGALGGLPAFAALRAGLRTLGAPSPSLMRADAAFGLRISPPCLVLLQVFGEAARTGEAGQPGRPNSLKVETSLIRDLTKVWSIQAGAFATPIGRQTRADRGLVLALWRRFQ